MRHLVFSIIICLILLKQITFQGWGAGSGKNKAGTWAKLGKIEMYKNTSFILGAHYEWEGAIQWHFWNKYKERKRVCIYIHATENKS